MRTLTLTDEHARLLSAMITYGYGVLSGNNTGPSAEIATAAIKLYGVGVKPDEFSNAVQPVFDALELPDSPPSLPVNPLG